MPDVEISADKDFRLALTTSELTQVIHELSSKSTQPCGTIPRTPRYGGRYLAA